MSGFQERLADAMRHEDAVIEALKSRDFLADRFGQGQLPEHQRDHLRLYRDQGKYPTPVRWMPDIIASKKFANRSIVIFVDAKAGNRYEQTGRHDLEIAAIESAMGWAMYSRCPAYFVFQDFRVATPEDVLEHGQQGQFRGSGSGTPFLLIPVDVCRPFDDVFGTSL